MATRKISMKQAWARDDVRRAVIGLVGCAAGGWGETEQARRRLLDELPRRGERAWSVYDLVDAVLTLDHADRYALRDDADSRVRAFSQRGGSR